MHKLFEDQVTLGLEVVYINVIIVPACIITYNQGYLVLKIHIVIFFECLRCNMDDLKQIQSPTLTTNMPFALQPLLRKTCDVSIKCGLADTQP